MIFVYPAEKTTTMKNIRTITLALATALAMIGAVSAFSQASYRGANHGYMVNAQNHSRYMQLSIDEMARRDANQIDHICKLSDSQYRKVFKFFRSEYQHLDNRSAKNGKARRCSNDEINKMLRRRDRRLHSILTSEQYHRLMSSRNGGHSAGFSFYAY
jgi:hypothetical protein